jgi:hypothetical protein
MTTAAYATALTGPGTALMVTRGPRPELPRQIRGDDWLCYLEHAAPGPRLEAALGAKREPNSDRETNRVTDRRG